jgi:ABC-type transport system involved in multi-copper enzyme maturation permease subunit
VLAGPIFTREWMTLPRRGRTFFARGAVVAALLVLLSTAWQVLAGTQVVRNVGDFARFGSIVFQVLAPLVLTAVVFFAALSTAAAIAYEKDRKTFDLLLLTNLSNSELVLGKLSAGLLGTLHLLLAVAPVFALTALLGGVGRRQTVDVLFIAAAAMLAAGSLGSTIALWREKTFQTLATTVLTIVVWTGLWEAVDRGLFGAAWLGVDVQQWAIAASAWHAAAATMRPSADSVPGIGTSLSPAAAHAMAALLLAAALNLLAILRVRVWNPTREILPRTAEAEHAAAPHHWSLAAVGERAAPTAVAGRGLRATRQVGDNPILWREVRTWAYGRKVVFIRLVFALLCVAAGWALWSTARQRTPTLEQTIPLVVLPAVVAALLINMQAVTAVTSERDARALDLLLVTDLTPKEFIFGKLGGIAYNAKEAILLPLLLCVLLWRIGVADGESALLLALGWLSAAAFAAMLGLHIGLHDAESRRAAAVSLGTIFFLIVGIAVSMRIMVAFSGSFQAQLQPFLATIVGGGVGLYVALGRRNPSPAITLASFLLPLATFYAITSFLVDAPLASLLATMGAYGFAVAALLIPAVYEFDVATGRTTSGTEES